MNRTHRQSGFVLLMALFLVMIAAVILASIANRSMSAALDARFAAEELQQRWAVTSLRDSLSPHLETLLDLAERGEYSADPSDGDAGDVVYENEPMPRHVITVRLAETDYLLILSDEQAKLNLNVHLADAGRADSQATVRRLLRRDASRGRTPAPEIDLRPSLVPLTSTGLSRDDKPFGGYGQVFPDSPADQLAGSSEGPGLTGAITLWGEGKLNIRRASDAVIEERCGQSLGPTLVAAILKARRDNPYGKLDDILAAIEGLDTKERAATISRFTDRSLCHGLWIVPQAPGRVRHHLSIILTEPQAPPPSVAVAEPASAGAVTDTASSPPKRPNFRVVDRHDFEW